MKLINKKIFIIALICTALFPLIRVQNTQAQEEQKLKVATKAPRVIKTAVPILLSDGYQIKSMQYLESSMVFVLQRGPVAFVCETDHNGISKLCVQIQ